MHATKIGNSGTTVSLPLTQRLLAVYRSEDFRLSFRVALSVVIVFYISLAKGWYNPHWAALAVVMCSLSTVGDSFNKGLLRILGTVLAAFAVVVLMMLFPQDRWYYLLTATLYIAFCAYMMGHSSRWYFWFIGAYVMALLAVTAGPVSSTIFEVLVLRVQQTSMGVIVYVLVSVLLWPKYRAPVLTQTVGSLADVQRRLLGHFFALLDGTPEDSEVSKLRAQARQAIANLPAEVDGAELDSFTVWEIRHLWRRCASDFAALNQAMEIWRQGFSDLKKRDLQRLIPGLSTLSAELDRRLASVADMLAGKAPQQWPEDVALKFDEGSLESVAHFDRAAILRWYDQVKHIEQLTRAQFVRVADICGFDSNTPLESPAAISAPAWTIDLDRLTCAVRPFIAVWITLLACIYIPGFPLGNTGIVITAAVAVMLALTPEVQVQLLVVPLLGSNAFAGIFHIFVMPHLHSFFGLGLGIFIAIFILCSLLSRPELAMARMIATSFFVMLIAVNNQQTYSFITFADFSIMLLTAVIALWISSWFPISLRPQQVIFKQLNRFLKSCNWLASPPHQDLRYKIRWTRRMWLAFHVHEVTTLPGKIGRWMGAHPGLANKKKLQEQNQALVSSLQNLGNCMLELVELRDAPQAEAIVRDLLADMRAWRVGIQEILHRLVTDPAGAGAALLQSRLEEKLGDLEVKIEKTLNDAPKGSASPEETANMYRQLNAYRGVSEALIGLAGQAAVVDWATLCEERF